MSFDLSQLDRVAKGEPATPPSSSGAFHSKTKLKFRPKVSRRKSKDGRQGASSLAPSVSEDSRPALLLHNFSDVSSYKESPSRGGDIVDGPLSIADNSGQLLSRSLRPESHELETIELQRDSKKRKSARQVEVENSVGIKRKSTKQARLEELAQLIDVTSLPLCDLISRASFLEDQKLQQEALAKRKDNVETPQRQEVCVEKKNPRLETCLAPQVTIVDGKLVVNEDSLEMRNQRTGRKHREYVRVEEGEDRIVNYHSYADWASSRASKWSAEESELLIQGIGQFGIDFSLLERLFPGRGRKQIKAKFSRMWKEDPEIFGKHFNKKEGETEETYDRFVQDLRAERVTYQEDFEESLMVEDPTTKQEDEKEVRSSGNENLPYWCDQDFHY